MPLQDANPTPSFGGFGIRHNRGDDLEQVFFHEYGISSPDEQRIEYYMLLDEFW